MLLSGASGLSGPSCAPPVPPPLPADCSTVARSPPPPSPTSRRCASRQGNAAAPTTSPTTPSRRRRQQHTSCSHSLRRGGTGTGTRTSGTVNPPVQWGDDTIANHTSSSTSGNAANQPGVGGEDEDEQFLSALAEHDFSSPSSYPSFTENLPPGEPSPPHQSPSQPHQVAAAANRGCALLTSPPRRASARNRAFAAPARSTSQLLSSTTVAESQHTVFSKADWGDEPLSQSSNASCPDTMPPPPPPPPPRPPLHGPFHTLPLNNRHPSRTLDVSLGDVMMEPSRGPRVPQDDDFDVFGDSIVPAQGANPLNREDLTTIDLTEATDVPEELKKPPVPEEDTKIRISKFQCVICMDDASTLTVTHCGHLYCAQCLHSSLHVEATKNKCPMCRAKIDIKSRANYNAKTKGFWPLELKLMTATRKGKRKAENIS
ncbi:hypothetical protein E4U41_003694 [Claviceps citrina]|nr:hypothetical protein E4U41_003694 [Claviceps citrina]